MKVSQIAEIETMIDSFTEEDNAAVYVEVEQLDKQIKLNHFEKTFRENLPAFERDIFDIAVESVEFQELAMKSIWDSLTILVKYQRAIEIYNNKHRYDEVA